MKIHHPLALILLTGCSSAPFAEMASDDSGVQPIDAPQDAAPQGPDVAPHEASHGETAHAPDGSTTKQQPTPDASTDASDGGACYVLAPGAQLPDCQPGAPDAAPACQPIHGVPSFPLSCALTAHAVPGGCANLGGYDPVDVYCCECGAPIVQLGGQPCMTVADCPGGPGACVLLGADAGVGYCQ